MSNETIIPKPKVRLKFIDMARSIAILLMLEGHFVDDSLALVYRDPESWVYSTWLFIRGFTAPVFLVVTGLIFVYLLLKNEDNGYFKNIRVKKGFKRVVELLFWGFVVQWYAFHVLECIASGILAILLIYGIYKIIRFIPLWIYFFAAGVILFSGWPYVKSALGGTTVVEDSWLGILQWIYNPNKGTVSWFPIFPWVGFTMFGAMIGALLHSVHKHIRTWYFPVIFFVVGGALFFFPQQILGGLDNLGEMFQSDFGPHFIKLNWLYEKVGMVLMELSVLILIDNTWGDRIKNGNLFLKVGQNTLTIYIIHMMVLYGSLIGIGINDFYHKALGPWQVAIGAASFIAVFVLLIKYLDWIKMKLDFILSPIRNFFNRIFFVS